MNALLALAITFTRAWVATYTWGLPSDIRAERCAEVGADLWEHRWLASRRGDPALTTAIEVLSRTLRGVLSDISWRTQASSSAQPDRSTKMGQSWQLNLALVGGIAVALLMVFIGIGPLPVLAIIPISIVVAIVGFRLWPRRSGDLPAAVNHSTSAVPAGRWKWLLAVTILSLATIVGMWLYATTLDHWGDTVTAMGFVALLCLVVAVTASSFLVADLTRGIARRPNS